MRTALAVPLAFILILVGCASKAPMPAPAQAKVADFAGIWVGDWGSKGATAKPGTILQMTLNIDTSGKCSATYEATQKDGFPTQTSVTNTIREDNNQFVLDLGGSGRWQLTQGQDRQSLRMMNLTGQGTVLNLKKGP